MTPDEYTVFMQTSDNRYSGIGVEVKIDEETEGIEVLGVYRDSGAWEAGIVIGDIITAVDGESITGFTLIDVRAVLKRPLGETAVLTVLRDDGLYYELTVTYNLVFVDPVVYELLSGNIGYVSIRNFDTGAADGFITAVNDLIEQGAVAFIYDVRSNNGGKVTEMTRILDFLLPEGVIFISVSRSGNEQIIMSDAASLDKPAVVLVNEHSYSGAEYFAAILSEYEYAHTVGEQTTGKNRMQTTIRLSSGSAVHLSTGEYLTKNRVSLFETDGFTPEYLISLTDEEYALFRDGVLDEATDPQLAKAISLLMD
jgi:carboxyl-terminal processing protease